MADYWINSDNWNSNNGDVEVHLEAKRKTDCSWHPCQVSLRSTGGLAVKFEGLDLEDVILDVEDAFASLRVRSAPLQGDDCCYIEEGKNVLAAYEKNSEELLFDAVVKKVLRVRHSKRAYCRCSFMIKWLFHNFEDETLTIPSGSIMKLAAESIKSHPVVAAFLDYAETSSLSTLFSYPAVFGETDHEIDLHGLLGRQIKEIGTLVDVSKTEPVKDTLLGGDHGVGFGGREARTKLLASKNVSKLEGEINCRRKHLTRSARKQKEKETKDEDLMTTAPSSGEESRVNKSPLSPLAARAVLASLVSKVPQKIGFLHHEEEKHVSLGIMSGMMMSGVYNSHSLHNIDTEPAKLVDNVRSSADKTLCTQNSHREPFLECDHKNNRYNITSPLSSIRDEESTQPVITGRVTRSAIKQGNRTSNGEVKSTKLAQDVTSARVTRSGSHKTNANMADDIQEALDDKPKRVTRTNSTAKEIEFRISKIEDNSKSCNEKANVTILTGITRVTRSAARGGAGTLDGYVKESLQDKSGSESAWSDYDQKHDCMSDSEVSEKKRASPLINVKLKSAESSKKQKASNDVDKKQKTTVERLYADVENQSQEKPSSSKNQSLQSSPQFMRITRSRSHAKS